MEINWHMVTFFVIRYIHILYGTNNYSYQSIYKKSVTVSINTVAIPNLDVNVWAHKSELTQGGFLRYLTQTEITRQIPF